MIKLATNLELTASFLEFLKDSPISHSVPIFLTRPTHIKITKEKVFASPLHTIGADRIPILL